jgi:DNA modification methylase
VLEKEIIYGLFWKGKQGMVVPLLIMDIEHLRPNLKDKLEWGKLATFVPNKKTPVYNWFYYKEGFARELVFELIKMFGLKEGDTVLDPFCGSGTTLLACKEAGIDSIGFDAIPSSILAALVKTGDHNKEKLQEINEWLFSERFLPPRAQFPPEFKRYFSKTLRDDVLFFKSRIGRIETPRIKDFVLLAFIRTVMRESWVWKDGGMLKVRKHPVAPFRKFFKRMMKRMIKESRKIQGTGKPTIRFGDARKIKLKANTIDGVITSPPYLNQINYTKVYGIENWICGQSRPTLRSYLGLGREDPVETYMKDTKQYLKEIFRVLKPGGKAGIVVGDAFVREQAMEIDLMMSALAEEIGFKVKEILVLNKRAALRSRTEKVGVLRESLIILEKP